MADPNRNSSTSLKEHPAVGELLRDSSGFDFFALLRELQAIGDMPAFGRALRPGDEQVRLAQETSLAFSPSAVSGARWRERTEKLEVLLRFTGLLGPNGPMPIHLTEYVLDRKRHMDDPTIEAFLNQFQHRIYTLFFRAWALNQPAVDFDRADERRHTFYLRSLIGLGTDGTEECNSIPDFSRLYLSGWLGSLSRSPDGLAAILTEFLGLPVGVQSFQGTWLTLPDDSRCRLGQSPSTGVLGQTCFAGDSIWVAHLKFRLRFGPLTRAQYERLLPGGETFVQVRDWVRTYVGDEYSWEAQLILHRSDVPACELGSSVRLGWTSWLGAPPPDRDVDDLVVQSP
jgi:type VI secretion system protein ImpH